MCCNNNVEENRYRQHQRLFGGEAVLSPKPWDLSWVSFAEAPARHSHGCRTWSNSQSIWEM